MMKQHNDIKLPEYNSTSAIDGISCGAVTYILQHQFLGL